MASGVQILGSLVMVEMLLLGNSQGFRLILHSERAIIERLLLLVIVEFKGFELQPTMGEESKYLTGFVAPALR